LRSSQPLLGTSNRRCKEDETLLKTCLPAQKKGLIFDLRDSSVLKTAQSRGGGYETDSNYPLWKRINKHLDRYDQLQTSFTRLVDTFVPSNGSTDSSSFLSRLEASTWLYNMRQCLHVACTIADEMLNRNACVLVHGNDGWDNTLVVCALVQIVINPEARTISGFELLIEREWLHAGHMFSKRCAKSAFGSTSHKQEAPVFLLFLDCVRQVIQEFYLILYYINKLIKWIVEINFSLNN
jgi:myotubularin-related protein 9